MRTPRFAFLMLVLTLQLNAEIIDRIVASVNGKIITASDIRKERILASVFGEPPKDDAALLQDVIDRTLVEEQIAQFPDVEVTDEEVDVALGTIKAPPDLPSEEFREAVRRRMLRARYFEFRFRQFIRASDEEIQKYYADVFVPEARARGLTQVPSLQEATESIGANIIDEKMSQEVQLWLESIRGRSNVEVFK